MASCRPGGCALGRPPMPISQYQGIPSLYQQTRFLSEKTLEIVICGFDNTHTAEKTAFPFRGSPIQ